MMGLELIMHTWTVLASASLLAVAILSSSRTKTACEVASTQPRGGMCFAV